MARIFITGSADGLGLLAAKQLVASGHEVVLHARNEQRGQDAIRQVAGAETVLAADLGDIPQTIHLAAKANETGRFDAVIHNAGVYRADAQTLFTVNTLAPYILTALMERPERLIYLSSGMHEGGKVKTDISRVTYSDTKLHAVQLCKAIARRWAGVYANAVNPGWVPTKMGGPGAPDNPEEGYQTQVWLATSNDPGAKVSGRYFFHRRQTTCNEIADIAEEQERLLKLCHRITGVPFPD